MLSELEADVAGRDAPTKAARYLAAVSGGAWAAAVWTLQKASQPAVVASTAIIEGLKAEVEPAGYPRQNYLMNGRGGILGALGWVLLSAATNLLLIGLLIYLVAWPMGRIMSGCAIDSGRLGPEHCGPVMLPRRVIHPIPTHHLYVPSIIFAVIGLLWLVVCGYTNRRVARTWPIGATLIAVSLLSLAYLIWIPALFALSGDEKHAAVAAIGSAIGGSVVVSIAGGVWKLVGGPLVHQLSGILSRALPRLLGLLLLLGGAAWALVVMYVVSKSTFPWASSWWAFAIPAVILVGMYLLLDPNWPTLHNIFSARLQRSFDPVANPFIAPQDDGRPAFMRRWGDRWSRLWARFSRRDVVDPRSPGTWAWLRTKTDIPELILCCAQQRNGISAGGLRAETFTISPRFVRQGCARSFDTGDYIDKACQLKRFPAGPLEFRHLEYVSAWLATTGAAFSSAMGRMSLGSTNAFLAAVNADLGIWLPNVKVLQEDGGKREAKKLLPRPRFAYTLKEILGWYNLNDRFVFITDGGHWENLGLVELLRRDCDVIYCADASGDPPASFAALRQALQLAALELGFDTETLDLDDVLDDMLPRTGSLPAKITTTFTLRRPSEMSGSAGAAPKSVAIHYMKLQAAQVMTPELKRWAIADPKFPRYSTMRQFLSTEQFENLVELGRIAGASVLGRAEPVSRSPRGGGSPW